METKFRVWKTGENGEMSLHGFEQLTAGVVWERKPHPSGKWEKGVFELGIRDRFSGYFDKNKNEICEGDILQLVNEALEEIRVICRFGHVYRKINGNEVDIAGFYFELPGKKNTLPIVKNYVGCHDCELMEIIGNIHENQNNAPKEPCKTNII